MRKLIPSTVLDVEVGIYVYCVPEIYLKSAGRHVKSPKTFKVYEVSPEGVIAKPPEELKHGETKIRCGSTSVPIYVVCKEGVSTLEVANAISQIFGVKVGYAGLKDADALTCQFMSLSCAKELELEPTYRFKNFTMYFHSYGTPLRRGKLLRNAFEVLVEARKGKAGDLLEMLKGVQKVLRGRLFPNFYGYQRFGSRRPVTHLIGRAIATGDYEEAVKLIAGAPTPFEHEASIKAREAFDRGDLREALELYPKGLNVERFVVRKLLEGVSPRDVILRYLSRFYLRLYLEAYQSYLFNIALSNAVLTYGSLEGFANECAVLQLPYPGFKVVEPRCDSVVSEVLREEGIGESGVGLKEWSLRVRDVGMVVHKFRVRPAGRGALISFELGRGSYASIFLRELLREGYLI